MVDYSASKPLGLVLIVTAHMMCSGPNRTEVTGVLGNNILLQFMFQEVPNASITSAGLYKNDTQKIHECPLHKNSSGSHVCVFDEAASSVFYCTGNLTLRDSGIYWAALFPKTGHLVKSDMVSLTVREANTSGTGVNCRTAVPPTAADDDADTESPSPRSFLHLVLLVLGASAAALLAGSLSWFIWSLKRTKEQQQQDPNPTEQETAEASDPVPASSLVYSVLDFPKRPQGGVEIQPTDTEYATISHPPKQSQV